MGAIHVATYKWFIINNIIIIILLYDIMMDTRMTHTPAIVRIHHHPLIIRFYMII